MLTSAGVFLAGLGVFVAGVAFAWERWRGWRLRLRWPAPEPPAEDDGPAWELFS